MKRYKKRTIALCLASALTVIGAFGADNYDNTLMALKVNAGSGGYINLTAYTEKPYNIPIKTSKINDNTYVVTLKDTNSSAAEPNIDNYDNIESIQIATYPYTTDNDGCTRIIIKTHGNPELYASSALFIPNNIINKDSSDDDYESEEDNNTYEEKAEPVAKTTENAKAEPSASVSDAYVPPEPVSTKTSPFEYTTIIFCISVLFLIIGLIYMFSRDKMASVVGDQGDFDVNEKKKKGKAKSIKSTINKLDQTYTSKTGSSDFSYNETDEYTESSNNTDSKENEQENVVVDLDMLYQESQKAPAANTDSDEEDENEFDDLADLLTSFSEEKTKQEEPEEEPFDEELYNNIINDESLSFTETDINKINQLLQLELSEETTEELKQYLSTPKKKKLTQEQVLEDLLSTYSIKQNINFSEEDVNAIKKLMNVELGPDFVKDFTTNPVRTKVVAQKIKDSGHKPHRTSDIITLNVKNMLPDLSEELRKQGGRRIESEVKPTVVYYSEGYEYKKLNVSDELPDISNNAGDFQNEYKPSYQEPIAASGYKVSTLSIKDALPDLADVKANPQKYENHTAEKPKADEKTLLKSLANVTFKPFYEDVENELNQFDNFEVIKSYSYYKEQEEQTPIVIEEEEQPYVMPKPQTKSDDNAAKLLKLIEAQQAERAKKKQNSEDTDVFKKELEAATKQKKKAEPKKAEEQPQEVYNLDGKTHTVLKTIKCTQNCECKIIQCEDKYTVVGNINGQEIVLKQYDTLKNASLYIRQNDKTDKTQYIVKVGPHKFIIKITTDNMEFVMDLC